MSSHKLPPLTCRSRLGGGPGRLFANVGTGTKNPTFTERFGYSPDTFVGNPDLKPETVHRVRGGYATGALFLHVLRQPADGRKSTGSFSTRRVEVSPRITVKDKSRRRGVEIGYFDTFFGLLNVAAHYTTSTPPKTTASRFAAPRHQGRVDLTGRIASSTRFNLGVAAVGQQYDNDFSAFPAIRRTLEPYLLVHGGLDYRVSPRTRIYVQMENAFDTDYEDVFGYRNPGRRVLAGCTLRL